jgi:5-methylcytosine-specific restriction protein A
VQAYRQLVVGERDNKAATYRELSERFRRKPGAYERRMQNISAVMVDLGMQPLAGLKPQRNIGGHMRPRLVRQVQQVLQPTETAPAACAPEVIALLVRPDLQEPPGQSQPQSVTKQVTDHVRDAAVKAWVLKQAQGRCECCGEPAPFVTTGGQPFLEVHHVHTLAEGGADTPSNTVALCPNCHRRLHWGADANALKAELYMSLPRLRRSTHP